MKKLKVLFVIIALLLLTGCQGSEKGTYLPIRIESADSVLTEDDDAWDTIKKTYKDQIYIKLQDDHKVEIKIISNPVKGTYELKDDNIIFTIDKQKVKCAMKDNKITFKQDDISIVFKKE